MLKTVFMGTPDFAVPPLAALFEAGYELCVFTQPDKPVGRGKKMSMPAVKEYALEHGIPVYQFASVRSPESLEALKAFGPDIMVTAAFGQILSRQVLDIPKLGCINVHASLLPAYRGAAPIQWAVINGEKKTGVTTMMTDIGLDTGDMLLSRETDILPDDTAQSLFGRLSHIGAELLLETLERLQKGTLVRIKQDEQLASYYPMIKESMAELDFSGTAGQLDCFVRGMYSWPVAFMQLEEGIFKVHKAHAENGSAPCGSIVYASPEQGLAVGCASGILVIDELQAPGGRPMSAKDYLRGHAVRTGQTVVRGSHD
ncbi:MAG: methionyl-tRNA formyltransferase [Firmicutes bacterium]|nr:methionyl-tRNA formyltransferase [Bacillota bacterium]